MFSKRWKTCIAAVLVCGLLSVTGPADAKPPYAEIVVDPVTGAVLHARNPDLRTQPASLTKIMTLFLAFEALDRGSLRLDQFIPVSRHAAGMPPSKLGLKAGSVLQVEDAILGLVTRSANDAAVVLAEALGGTEQDFARMMTAKAHDLGMADTVFRNASGLPNGRQVTTARDMAKLSQALIERHPRRYHYFSQDSFTYEGTRIKGHNRLLLRYQGMDGIKTGFVNASGFNLAASAVRDGRRLIAVLLGGSTARERDDRVAALLDQGFGGPAAVVVAATGANASKGGYTIQIGTYRSAKWARTGLTITRERLGGLLPGDAAYIVVTTKGKLFQARFTGLSKDTAASACRRLEQEGQDCLVLAAR